jgi:hypothetical protein
LWQTYWQTGEPFGFCFWVALMASSAIDMVLETPFGAIPNYLILGLALARPQGNEEVNPDAAAA